MSSSKKKTIPWRVIQLLQRCKSNVIGEGKLSSWCDTNITITTEVYGCNFEKTGFNIPCGSVVLHYYAIKQSPQILLSMRKYDKRSHNEKGMDYKSVYPH